MKLFIAGMLVFVFGTSSTVFAGGAEPAGFEAMQKQLQELKSIIELQNKKIGQLEKKQNAIRINGAGGIEAVGISDEEFKEKFDQNLKGKIGKSDKWLKDLNFKADYRLRYEAFDFTSGSPAESNARNRFRMRLRYGWEKKFSPDMKVGFFLSSGGTTDPTSTNATLDTNFTFKSTVIERAYVLYTPGWAEKGVIDKLTIGAGKFKNPFEKGSSKMIWDRDVRPEGAYQKFDFDFYDGDNVDLGGWLTFGQFVLDEDGSSQGDAELYAFQAGVNTVFYTPFFERPADLNLSTSWYNYNDYAEAGNFGTLARGNPNIDGVAASLDANDFSVIEGYADLTVYPYGKPLKFYFDFAHNLVENAPDSSAGGQNIAWALGAKLGKAAKKGDWQVGADYRYIEANSVVGAFNDSDFGLGHADKRGSSIFAKYKLTDDLTLAGTAFFVNNITAGTLLRDEEQRRFQLDLVWKF